MIWLRRIAVALAAVFAVVVSQLNASGVWGQSPAEFAADSDANLRVAGWAFSIWGLLFLGILAFAVWQFRRRADAALLDLLAWPAALGFLLTGSWIVAAATDAEALTVIVIVSAAVALIAPLWVGADRVRAADRPNRVLIVWPLAALAGWLTVASPVNIVTVLSGNGELPDPALVWTLFAVAVVTVLALLVSRRTRTAAYALPISWGLTGVAIAEWTRNPPLAWAAVAGVAVSLAGGLWLSRSRSVANRD